MDILLDTNILVTYSRDNEFAHKMENDLNLFSEANRIAISVVTLGGLASLFDRSKYGKKRNEEISRLIKRVSIIDINIQSLINNYGKIDSFSQGKFKEKPLDNSPRNMGKNDLWIAATAATFNMTLVTTDKDFNHLDGEFISLDCIDLRRYI